MAKESRPDKKNLARQARRHLDSLKSAGIEWLPAADASHLPPMAQVPQGGKSSERVSLASTSPPASEPASSVAGTPASAESLEERRRELTVLARDVSECRRCPELVVSRTQTVFGVGQPGAELCFIGEAPGADEDKQGEPFVGAAGQLLNRILAACHLKHEEVYICNILKCRPPNNRTPLPQEAANCRGYLEKQLELVQPKFICTLGGCAAQNLLGTTQPLGKLRGRFHDYRGIPVLCTYHPAYLLPHHSPEKKKDVWEDMKLLLARMGRPIK